MKKLFLSLSRFLLLACLLLGSIGQAWGEEETLASFSNSSNTGWTISGSPSYSNTGGYQLVASSMTITSPSIEFSKYSNINITLTCRTYGGPNNTQKVISIKQGSTNGTQLATFSPGSTSLTASKAIAISPTSDASLVIYCPGASSSKGCGISEIVIKGTPKGDTPSTPGGGESGDTDPKVDYATLPFSYSGDDGKEGIANVAGLSQSGLSSNYAEQNAPYRLKFDGAGDYVVVKLNAQPGVCTFGVKKLGGETNSTFKVQGSVDGTDYSDVQSFTTTGDAKDAQEFTTTNSFVEGTRYVKIMMSAKGANVGLGTISISAASSPSSTTLSVEGVTNNTISFASIERDQSANKTFTLSGSNLTADASLVITGTNAAMFRVSPSSITPTDGSISNASITVTYAPTAIGSHSATLTISTDGTDPKVISLTGSATAPAILYGITCAAPESGCSYTVKIGDAAAETITAADSKEALEGKTITLTTTAGPGYVLSSDPFTITHANGSIKLSKSGDNYSFTMPGYAVTITANYSKTYTLTKGACENGSITAFKNNNVAVTEISYRSKVVVETTANEHYHITGMYYVKEDVTGNTTINAENGVYSFSMPQSNVTVYATFEEDPKHDAIFSVNGLETRVRYYEGQTIVFEAPTWNIPDGKEFMGWSANTITGTQETEPTYTNEAVMETTDVTFYAVFATQTGEGNPNILKSVSGTITSGDYYIVDTYLPAKASVGSLLQYWAAQGGVDSNNGVPAKMVGDANSSYISVDAESGQLTIDLSDVEDSNKPSLYTFTISDGSVRITQGENEIYGTVGTSGSVNANLSSSDDGNINWASVSSGVNGNSHLHQISIVSGTSTRYLIYCDHTSSGASQNRFKNYSSNNMNAGGGEKENSYGAGSFYFLQAGSATYSAYCTSVITNPTIGTGNWSTFCRNYDYVVTKGTAYSASLVNGVVTLTQFTEGTVFAAGTGVAIKAEGTYTVAPATGDYTVETETGFVGTIAPTAQEEGCAYYGITTKEINGEKVTGFAKASSTLTLPAGKAFLCIAEDNRNPAPARLDMTVLDRPSSPITTDVEAVNKYVDTKKMLVRGQLVIVRGSKMYDMNGRLVK